MLSFSACVEGAFKFDRLLGMLQEFYPVYAAS